VSPTGTLRQAEAKLVNEPQNAAPQAAERALEGIVEELEIVRAFPAEVSREVERLKAEPGIVDPKLVDCTALPFVTIDGPTSKDLDQALYIEASGKGHVVHYALADAAYYVPTASALFQEALRRGASFYFPGFSVPMLPRELSEGLISLNPAVDRRALVFEMKLDEAGRSISTRVIRARVHSRAKLAWGDVQRFYDDPSKSPIAGQPFADSLRALREVGKRRILLAEAQDVVRYHRREVEIKTTDGAPPLDPAGAPGRPRFVVIEAIRDEVELYNEQISLLVNREGGRMLAESSDPRLQPIYRVHPAPDPEKLGALAALTRGVAVAHGLDVARWALTPGESLNAFLSRLPKDGPELRIARALERQAILVNMRSAFSAQPSAHFGVGAEVYARFSAPMREVVGIFVHKELLELGGLERPGETRVDEALREAIVTAANRSRDTQRKVNDHVNRRVLDAIFKRDLGTIARHRGTVMGMTSSKIHVELDQPGMDVKVYLRDIGKQLAPPSANRKRPTPVWLDLSAEGAVLATREDKKVVCVIGDAVDVTALAHDESQDRWVLGLERVI